MRTPWVVGISGASGTPYARSVLRGLMAAGEPVDLVVSRAARLTMLDETGVAWRDDPAHVAQWLGLGRADRRPALAGGRPGGRPVQRLVSGARHARRPRLDRSCGGNRTRAVEGPAAALGRRDAEGRTAARCRPARDAAGPRDPRPPARTARRRARSSPRRVRASTPAPKMPRRSRISSRPRCWMRSASTTT